MPIDNSTRFPKPLAADLRELSEGMAIVIDGDTAPKAIASGQYLFIKNHSTLATGGYHATAAIASGADITSSNVTPDADGIVNGAVSALSEHIANKYSANNAFTAYDSNKVINYQMVTSKADSVTVYIDVTVPNIPWTGEFIVTSATIKPNYNSPVITINKSTGEVYRCTLYTNGIMTNAENLAAGTYVLYFTCYV